MSASCPLSMWSSASNRLRILRSRASLSPITVTTTTTASLLFTGSTATALMEKTNNASFSASALPRRSGGGGGSGRGRGLERREDRQGHRGGGGPGKDRIDALGRLLTRVLRHMASELNLNIRSDGYVKVNDVLNLNMKTFAGIPLSSHTVDDIREAVRKDNKQRFSLMEENGELFIRANQGHTIETIESESLLKPILSAQEVPVCVHGTYKKNLESILQSGLKHMTRLHVHFSSGLPMDGDVISGMRRNVNVLIFLDVRKALEDGMKLYISDNKVILTEGFDGVVPIKYFEKIESWPDRQPIPF
ncbi:tRNA 2'-phosphotransferase 1 [Macadamia integrifolia]|uniref:tRNA 2'-phosphotransferase 1 n=1 Tax=Macadamia integrifolia TaxID=60698 RepID=UPI001C4F50F4|nr:tRNA 2'-phosphotransferase 1 [Macadamia integrifolia]